MKIINLEDNKEVVYVQTNDLICLMNFGGTIPAEIIVNYFGGSAVIINDDDRFEFIKFTEPSTVEFFKECDWVVDFRDIKTLSMEQIIEVHQGIIVERNNAAEKWNLLTDEEREANPDLYKETKDKIERLEFKAQSILEILWTKQGHRVMPFPVVPDRDGFTVENDDCPYMAKQGVNPLQVLIYKKDGTTFEGSEIFPVGLIDGATNLTIMYNLDNNEFFGDNVKMTRELTDDGKYFVTTFAVVPKLTEEQKKQKSNSEQPRSLGKRIKDWWNKRKSN